MRPKLLEIEGLQSFRNAQRINFEVLGETGLFGIFGSTGSGKSTVLDAITFALYGKVKRADRGTQGIINTNRNTASVYFTFEIDKNGSRKTYRVERTYRRKKGSQNACVPKVVRFIEVTGTGEIPICDKTSEVSGYVEELLGLSHDDFTRAVVLPQNSFHEFLMLDNYKKRDMLERIFYLEAYGKQLWEKINRKMSGLKSRMDVLSGELKGYSDATDEAVEEAERNVDTAISERKRVEDEFRLQEIRYTEAKEVWQLVQDLGVISQRKEQHDALQGEIQKKRVKLENASKADGLIDRIQNNRELSEKLQETVKQMGETNEKLSEATKALKETRQKTQDIKQEMTTAQPKLVEQRIRLTNVLGIKKEMEGIQEKINESQEQAVKLDEKIKEKTDSADKIKRELEFGEQSLGKLLSEIKSLSVEPEYRSQIQTGAKLENELDALKANEKELLEKRTALNNAIAKLEQKMQFTAERRISLEQSLNDMEQESGRHQDSMPESRNSVIEYKDQLNTLQNIYDGLINKKTELEETRAKIHRFDLSLEKLLTQFDSVKGNIETTKTIKDKRKIELEQAVGAMSQNTAYMLSKNLNEGDPCPVCGSEHHPKPAAKTNEGDRVRLEQNVKYARDKLETAETEYREAEREGIITSEQINAVKQQKKQTENELKSKADIYKKEKLRLPEELRHMEPKTLFSELEKMNIRYIEKQKALENWEKKREEYKDKIEILRKDKEKEKIIENGFLSELRVNRDNLNDIEKVYTAAREKTKCKHKEYNEFIDKYKVESANDELEKITKSDRSVKQLQNQADQVQGEIDNKKELLERCKEDIRVLNDENIKIQAYISSLKRQNEEKKDQLKEFADNNHIEQDIKEIDNRLEAYDREEQHYRQKLEVIEKQYNSMVTQNATLKNQYAIFSENLKKEDDFLKAALLEKGFTNMNEVEESVLSGEDQQTIKDEIDSYDQKESNLTAQKEMIQKRLKSRNVTEEEWNQAKNRYQVLKEYKEECISQSEVLKNHFSTLKKKHARWVELEKTYHEVANQYGLYEQIQKLLRAERGKDNSFIDYIAEERLRYVAAKASETLGIMTKFKYALELDVDSGFVIRDNANGGVHRMVTSLSGGETFLVSLSLALALSEQIQLKGQNPLEFFFLDEGFGTLDSRLLDTVIDSLERLSKKERVIGLISHVPELRNRIARRLIIESPSLQGDGSRVRIEKA